MQSRILNVSPGSGRRMVCALASMLAWAACTGTDATAQLGGQGGETPMDRVHFQVEREADVENDRAVAVVGVTDEDSDAAVLSQRINTTMSWALERAKKAKGVDVESGGYQTSAVYDNGKIRRWRGSQDLRLESGEVAKLSQLIGVLQERLLVRAISFEVSPTKRRQAEEALIAQALAAFQERARKIGEGLGARSHALVDVYVDTAQRGGPMPRGMAMRASSAEMAPPALEGGKSTVSVTVRGTIELER